MTEPHSEPAKTKKILLVLPISAAQYEQAVSSSSSNLNLNSTPGALANSVTGYVISHWHAGRRKFEKNKETNGIMDMKVEKNGNLPIEAYSWLATHFSHVRDHTIGLVFFNEGKCFIAVMQSSRNGIDFGKKEDQEKVSSKCNLQNSV